MNDKYYLIRESSFSSFLADTYTFVGFGSVLYANHRWLGDHAIVAVLLVLMISLSIYAKQSKKIKRFDSVEELKKHLQIK